ncbi:MAG: hypothetical protein LBC49_00050, partial [Bacteroidales bacterium]|nr:hypothetical protein [Bacteroidales bacterium]
MKKKLFFSCALAFLAIAGVAVAGPATQNGNVNIVHGQRGKYIFFKDAGGMQEVSSSPDMRYIGGGRNNRGFIYDIITDSFFFTENSAKYILSPDLYAGDSKIVKNGQIITLDQVYFGKEDSWKDLGIWATTPNLDKIFVMGYMDAWDYAGNRNRIVNYAFVYNSDGHVTDTITPVWPMATTGAEYANSGYGERVNASNNDGTILAGHSSYPSGNTNFTAAFWDLQNDTSFGLFRDPENPEDCWGTLETVNNDGSIIIGNIGGNTWLIRYDRQTKSYTREKLLYSPGMGYSLSSGISETGLILYIQSTSVQAPESRETYLYNIIDGDVVKLDDYCKELYGIEINYPTATGSSISDNGRLITGWTFENAVYYPYAIVLDSIQLYARPRNVIAKQLKGTSNVNITWQLPIKNMHTLTGFDVYRDGQKVNSSLINASTKSYEDISVDAGVHDYSVKALYGDSVSNLSEKASVLVIELSGCLPVQKIESNVIYNRTVQVNWGLPSAQMSNAAGAATAAVAATAAASSTTAEAASTQGSNNAGFSPNAMPQQKGYINSNIDIINLQDMKSYTSWSAIVVGDKLLMGEYDRGGIKIYDAETYEYLETVD